MEGISLPNRVHVHYCFVLSLIRVLKEKRTRLLLVWIERVILDLLSFLLVLLALLSIDWILVTSIQSIDVTEIHSIFLTVTAIVISVYRYRNSALRQSAIFRDRPMAPADRAAFWVEHVIRHGGDYMQSPANEIAWYQYHMLDVLAFVAGVFLAVLIIACYTCRVCLRLCMKTSQCHRNSGKEKAE